MIPRMMQVVQTSMVVLAQEMKICVRADSGETALTSGLDFLSQLDILYFFIIFKKQIQ